MASEFLPLGFPQFSVEMVKAVAANAARDAERLVWFLNTLGLEATSEQPRSWPPEFLLHMSAGVRLLVWESQGHFLHREIGLPDARQVIHDAFLIVNESKAANTLNLCCAVWRLAIERFAWAGQSELGADISLDEVDEDLLHDAVADFLWAIRSISTTGS